MNPGQTIDAEKTNLEIHVDLCAQRYHNLEKRLDAIEEKVSLLQELIQKSHLNTVKVLVGTAGTVVAGILSILVVIYLK